MDRVEILGVQIDNVTWDEALIRIREMMRSDKPHQIITPNIELVILARRDAVFRKALEQADLVVADGMQVVFASRWHKTPLKARITGVDLVPAVCRIAAEEKAPVFFLGGEEGIAAKTAQCLLQQIPDLIVAGVYTPPMDFGSHPDEIEKAIQVVNQASPTVLFVALGSPKQENWIYQNKERLGASVMIGIGGAFNMISGKEKRAPQWLQRLGMEGLWRLVQRPLVIWKRVVIHAPLFFLLLLDLFTYRTQKRMANWIRPSLLTLGDVTITPFMFLFSCWLYFRSGLFSNMADPFPDYQSLLKMPAYSDLLLVISILTFVSFWFHGCYARDKYISISTVCSKTLKVSITLVFFLICFQFLFMKRLFITYSFKGFSRMVFGLFGLFSFASLFCWRWLFSSLERFLHRKGVNLDRIVLAGSYPYADPVIQSFVRHPEWGNVVLGYVCSEGKERDKDPYYLGSLSDLARLLPARKVDEVLIVDPNLPLHELHDIGRICRSSKVGFSLIPSIHELLGVSSEIKQMGDFRVITVAFDRSADRFFHHQ